LNLIELYSDYTSEKRAEAVNLIKSFDLIDPIKFFEEQMASQKTENLIKKTFQLAQESK
jgi:hypothetical protein